MRDKIYKILLLGVILTAGYLLVYWFFKFSLPHPGMRDVKVEKLYPKSVGFLKLTYHAFNFFFMLLKAY